MTEDTQRRAERIFRDSLDVSPEKRREFLDRECSGDSQLRRKVESLLGAVDADDDFLESLDRSSEEDDLLGRSLGNYRIESRIGGGGMGTVYLGVRREDFRQQVAIKVVRAGPVSEETIRRFVREREIQAKAGSRRPNIASVIDGGTSADGRPYLVMEYIEGRPIDIYCDEEKFSVEQKLALFLRLSETVQWVHRNLLVVHRDLKPSNILVGSDGVPKLLDFGIAKLLKPEIYGAKAALTRNRLLTPDWAAPEQVFAEPITTATDVYLLGILLYRLLTGRMPFPAGDLFKEVRNPVRPSSRVLEGSDADSPGGPMNLSRRLQGDLDAIVMKALRFEPAERYESVEQLAEDVHRHLHDRPIRIRHEDISYRAGKFVRRHRIGVTVASLVLGLSIAYGVTMARLSAELRKTAQRAEAAADQAIQEAERSKAVLGFLQETLASPNPEEGIGREATVIEALDAAVARIDETFDGEPGIEAAVRNTVGFTYFTLGRYDEAEPLLRSALDLWRGLHSEDHPDVAMGSYSLGRLLKEKGKLQEAEQLYRESIRIRRRWLDPGPERALSSHELAISLTSLGVLLRDQGRLADAEPLFLEAFEIVRQIFPQDHQEVLTAANNVAALLTAQKKYDEAEPHFEAILETSLRIYGPDHLRVGYAYVNLGHVSLMKGDFETALSRSEQADRILTAELGQSHPQLATVRQNLANALYRTGRLKEAEAILKRVIENLVETAEPGDWRLANARALYGSVLVESERYDVAEKHLLTALESFEATLGDAHERTRSTLDRLVALYEAWNLPDKAAPYRQRLETLPN